MFFLLFVCLFVLFCLWLCWVFVSVRGLSLVAPSGGHSSSRCAGLSLSRPLLLRSTGSRRAGSAIVAHGPSRSVAYGIFPDQGSNPRALHWQADSQPLCHQGSPIQPLLKTVRRFLTKLNTLTIWSNNYIPWYLPKEVENLCTHKNLHKMLTAALFITAEIWKPPRYPSVNEGINISTKKKWAKKKWLDSHEKTEET